MTRCTEKWNLLLQEWFKSNIFFKHIQIFFHVGYHYRTSLKQKSMQNLFFLQDTALWRFLPYWHSDILSVLIAETIFFLNNYNILKQFLEYFSGSLEMIRMQKLSRGVRPWDPKSTKKSLKLCLAFMSHKHSNELFFLLFCIIF